MFFNPGISQNIDKVRKMFKDFLEIRGKHNFSVLNDCQISFSLRLRRLLMKIRTCISKYSIHIAALKPDSKFEEMPRVTYNEIRFDIMLDPQLETEKVVL